MAGAVAANAAVDACKGLGVGKTGASAAKSRRLMESARSLTVLLGVKSICVGWRGAAVRGPFGVVVSLNRGGLLRGGVRGRVGGMSVGWAMNTSPRSASSSDALGCLEDAVLSRCMICMLP